MWWQLLILLTRIQLGLGYFEFLAIPVSHYEVTLDTHIYTGRDKQNKQSRKKQ